MTHDPLCPANPDGSHPGHFNFCDLIARARADERDKGFQEGYDAAMAAAGQMTGKAVRRALLTRLRDKVKAIEHDVFCHIHLVSYDYECDCPISDVLVLIDAEVPDA